MRLSGMCRSGNPGGTAPMRPLRKVQSIISDISCATIPTCELHLTVSPSRYLRRVAGVNLRSLQDTASLPTFWGLAVAVGRAGAVAHCGWGEPRPSFRRSQRSALTSGASSGI